MFSIHLIKKTKSIWLIPFTLMATLMLIHLLFEHYGFNWLHALGFNKKLSLIETYVYFILLSICGYWLAIRAIDKIFSYLKQGNTVKKYPSLLIMIPFFARILKTLTALVLFNRLTQHLDLPADLVFIFDKISSIFIICAVSGIVFKLITIARELVLHHYAGELRGNIVERKIYTQTLILKRLAYALVFILTAGAVLILFDNVRALGASVLTTAGIFGLIVTFTAQRSLGSIFSGLEIALTQAIKIGDKVVIDNEVGTIEDINFRSVVIKLWDWRRLIVPTSFFLEKPFQNWNHVENSSLIGTVYLHVDFTMPLARLRNKLLQVLNESNLWDGHVNKLNVNELRESSMQLKILVSAKNSDDVSSLCAIIREELIVYILNHFPASLPKTRSTTIQDEVKLRTEQNHTLLTKA